jgi:hypothetical protein
MSERKVVMSNDELTSTGPRHVVTIECLVVAGDPAYAMETVVKPITRPALRTRVSVRSVKAARLDQDC